MSDGQKLTPADLELETHYVQPAGPTTLREAKEKLEKNLIQQALGRHRGNLTRVADDLGISRPTLYELMERLGISKQRT
jgi:two-component system NtrC family response regulator